MSVELPESTGGKQDGLVCIKTPERNLRPPPPLSLPQALTFWEAVCFMHVILFLAWLSSREKRCIMCRKVGHGFSQLA